MFTRRLSLQHLGRMTAASAAAGALLLVPLLAFPVTAAAQQESDQPDVQVPDVDTDAEEAEERAIEVPDVDVDVPESETRADENAEARQGDERQKRSTKTHRGKVVRAADGRLVMSIDGRNEHSHRITDDTRILIDGKRAKLSDLKEGDRIAVTTPADNLGVALRVKVMRGDDAEQGERPAADSDNRPSLGIFVQPSLDREGVHILDVVPDGPADKAGIRPGDQIMALDGKEVTSPRQLLDMLQDRKPDTQVDITVERENERQELTATLAAREQAFDNQPTRRDARFRNRQQGEAGRSSEIEQVAWMGVALDENEEEQGAKITAVYPSGPAARAGLRADDVITRVGDQEIASAEDLAKAVQQKGPNQQVAFTVKRGDEEQELDVRLGSQLRIPEARGETYSDENRDSRRADRQQRQQGADERDEFDTRSQPGSHLDMIPEHAIVLEQNRHLCVQNERLERLMLEVLRDVRELRQEVAELRGDSDRRGADRPRQRDRRDATERRRDNPRERGDERRREADEQLEDRLDTVQ